MIDRFQELYEKALKLLSSRPRSEKEIRDYLERKVRKWKIENCEMLINKVIEKLGKQDLINDESFAVWWCQQRIDFRPRSKKVLAIELWHKGVEEKVVKKTIDKMIDEEELVKKLIFKKRKLYSGETFKKKKQKLARYLLRRGFLWPVVEKMIDSLPEKG